MRNGAISFLELPFDSDDTVLLLPLLLESERVDRLDLTDRADSDPDADLDPDLDPADRADRPLFEDRSDFAVCLELDVLSDLEDVSERSDRDDSSEMEDTLVLEVMSDTVDRAVVDLFCSGSCSGWMLITLERKRHNEHMLRTIFSTIVILNLFFHTVLRVSCTHLSKKSHHHFGQIGVTADIVVEDVVIGYIN